MIRLCVLAPSSYPLFDPSCEAPFGGGEVYLWLIARALARMGRFDVHVIVFDYGQPAVQHRDGVTLHAWREMRDSAPPRRVAAPRRSERRERPVPDAELIAEIPRPEFAREYSRLAARLPAWVRKQWRARGRIAGSIGRYRVRWANLATYKAVDADVYMVSGNTLWAAELAFFCRQRGKPLLFVAASDGDYEPIDEAVPLGTGSFGVPHYLTAYTMREAYAHVLQTDHQADMLREGFGREAIVVRSPIDMSARKAPAQGHVVLWVGRWTWIKQPQLLIALARRLPECQFVMVAMTSAERRLIDKFAPAAAALPNLDLHDYVPFADIDRHFGRARVLVNTSVFEGFPSTFLQAASHGVPIASYVVDPDGMLTRYGCGRAAGRSVERLAADVRELMTSSTAHARASAAGLAYVRGFHDKDLAATQYARAIELAYASATEYTRAPAASEADPARSSDSPGR